MVPLLKYVGRPLKRDALNKHQSQALSKSKTIVQTVQRRRPTGNWQVAGETVSRSWFTCYLAFWPADGENYHSALFDFFPLTGPEVILVCLYVKRSFFFPLAFFLLLFLRSFAFRADHLDVAMPIWRVGRDKKRDVACCLVPADKAWGLLSAPQIPTNNPGTSMNKPSRSAQKTHLNRTPRLTPVC